MIQTVCAESILNSLKLRIHLHKYFLKALMRPATTRQKVLALDACSLTFIIRQYLKNLHKYKTFNFQLYFVPGEQLVLQKGIHKRTQALQNSEGKGRALNTVGYNG